MSNDELWRYAGQVATESRGGWLVVLGTVFLATLVALLWLL